MSDINQWNVNMDMINIAYNLAQWLIVAVAAVCGVSVSAGSIAKAVRWAARAILPQVDEPAEQQAIGAALHVPPEYVEQFAAILKMLEQTAPKVDATK